MTVLEKLIQTIQELREPEQVEVLHFVEYLKDKSRKRGKQRLVKPFSVFCDARDGERAISLFT